MFQRILYTSRATPGVGLRNVYDIIRVSHNRNSVSGLTGGLLFLDGYFIQVLEGAPYAVAERYMRILRDDRHCDIVQRLNETSSELLFPADWMALRDGSEIDPKLLSQHGYRPGLPLESFDGRQVLGFLLDCFSAAAVG